MLSKVIALFMALLIGNPMCCCAMASLFEDDVPEQTKPNVHSCCSHSIEDSEDEDRPDKPDCCPCFLEKERSLTAAETLFLKADAGEQIAKALFETDCSLSLPHLSPVVSHLSKWPPGSLPIPSLRGRLALSCCYLL